MGQVIGAVIFEGGVDSTPLDRELREIRMMLTLELIAKCTEAEGIDRTILVTDHQDLIARAGMYPVDVYPTKSDQHFHFGRALMNVCRRYQLQDVIVFSGAGAPLMSALELDNLVCLLENSSNTVIANNPQSADVIAFSPADTLERIELPDIDNPLPWILKEEGKLELVLLPVTIGYNFDLDTPLDAVYLSLHPQCPDSVRLLAGHWHSAAARLTAAAQAMKIPNAEVLVSGRVGPWIMAHMNEHVRCRLRVISEERGMKALGREEKQEVYSMLGTLMDLMGLDSFFRYLETYCDVAFIDTRVLFGHWKLQPDSNDRFYSDLGEYSRIKDPVIQELTRQAVLCRIPVVLGGHSTVAGGMMVLIDAMQE
jgi:hypothetical protein